MNEAAREAAKEARRAYKRQWARDNPEKVKAAQQRYWAKRAGQAAQAEAATIATQNPQPVAATAEA